MKNAFIILFLVFSINCISDEELDPKIFFKKFPKEMQNDNPKLDENILGMDDYALNKLKKDTMENIKYYILDIDDCLYLCKKAEFKQMLFLSSKSAGKIINYYYSLDIYNNDNNNSCYINLDYEIYETKEKARIGTRYKYAYASGTPNEETYKKINKSLTGKKIGDFSIILGNTSDRPIYFDLLYDRIWVGIMMGCDESFNLTPEYFDNWVETVINKIKKGLGEKVEAKK